MPRGHAVIASLSVGEVSPRLHGRVDIELYQKAAAQLENWILWPQGGATTRPGTRFVAEVKASANLTRLLRFEFSVADSYIVEAGNAYMRFYRSRGVIESSPGVPYEIVSPYLTAHVTALRYAQSADVLYITHPSYAQRKLSRLGHTSWTISEITFSNGPFQVENLTGTSLTVSAATGSGVTLTASSALFNASYVGSLWKLREPDFGSVQPWEVNRAYALNAVVRVGARLYVCTAGGTSGAVTPNHTEGEAWDGLASAACKWRFVNHGYGVIRITGYTSTTVMTGDIVTEMPASVVSPNVTTKWSPPAWSTYLGWPAVIVFHEQRAWYGGAPYLPTTIWGSATALFEDFMEGDGDDEAVIYALASNRLNAIQWMASGSSLLLGTAAQEYQARAADQGVITPTSVAVLPATAEGSISHAPLQLGDVALFLNRSGKRLQELVFDQDVDSLTAPDLTIRAEHLTKTYAFAEIEWLPEPWRAVIARRSDGVLCGMTYRREEEVVGWWRFVTDGVVESVAVIPSPDGLSNDLWMIVRRTIGSATKRYVEYLAQPHVPTSPTDKAGACYLDSSLEYNGSPATTISGLSHLEGKEVGILADGKVHPRRTVASGAVTLDYAASRVVVGLPYRCTLETLSLEMPIGDGTSQARKKRVSQVALRLVDSLGGKVGHSLAALEPIEYRTGGMPMDASPPLFTGDKIVSAIGDYDRNGKLFIVQDDPLPLSVAAIFPIINVSGS